MATEDLVTEQFQFLGIDIQKEVLARCVSLCHQYNIDPETFTEQWMAYSINHLSGAQPSLENLEIMEKRELSKWVATKSNTSNNEINTYAGSNILHTSTTLNPSHPDDGALSNYMPASAKINLHYDLMIFVGEFASGSCFIRHHD